MTSRHRRPLHIGEFGAWFMIPVLLMGVYTTGCKSGPRAPETSDSTTVKQAAHPRPVTIHFVLDESIRSDLDAPASGTLRGAIFRTSEVGAMGPRKSAEPVTKMDPTPIDLSDPDRPIWTTPPLEPGEYTFLGFVDLDENSPDGPDDGDLVTRPKTNQFSPTDAPDPLEVRFDYIKGSTIFGQQHRLKEEIRGQVPGGIHGV